MKIIIELYLRYYYIGVFFENIAISLYKKLISDEKNMEDILTERIQIKKEDFSKIKSNKNDRNRICC